MTMELAVRTGLPGTLRPNGYDLPPDLSYDEWRGVLALTEHIASASPWWLGDALVYGERRFPDRHSQALPTAEEDPDGARQSRIKSAVWVSSKFPPVTRVTSLSWSHHRAVAELDQPVALGLLEAAERQKWATRKLIEKVTAHKEAREADLGRAVDADGVPIEEPELWRPTRADLTAACRTALDVRLSEMGPRHRIGFEAGWLASHVHTDDLDCFVREEPQS